MSTIELRGTFCALYTPFGPDGGLDEPALRSLAERLVAADVGLVPCGTTGETPTLSREEYLKVVGTAVEVAADQDRPVIAGTGANDTQKAIATTRLAKEAGVDVALVVTPYYNKPPQASLVTHFLRIADEGGLPVILYNVPGRTGCNMTAETTLQLAEHPNIVAVKEASGNLGQIQTIAAHKPDGFALLSGDDELTLPMVLLGGAGVISVTANVTPQPMVALVAAALAGDLERARALQWRLLPLFRALFCTTSPIPVKHAAALLGHARPDVRLPLTADAMTEAQVAQLTVALEHVRAEG